ncbi:MAG: hypothetical protein N2484_17745 [Clostridia bacterium]|nr:hypothetical protein [Clostridia bacterium]
MKIIAYLFLGIILVSVILAPTTELLCLFGDLCKINAALISSSRAAVLSATDDHHIQDAEAAIDETKFEELFKESFCNGLSLKLDSGNPNHLIPDRIDTFNDFTIKFSPESGTDSNGDPIIIGCIIEVKTNYKFKTELMKKFVEQLDSKKTSIRLSRNQTLKLDF